MNCKRGLNPRLRIPKLNLLYLTRNFHTISLVHPNLNFLIDPPLHLPLHPYPQPPLPTLLLLLTPRSISAPQHPTLPRRSISAAIGWLVFGARVGGGGGRGYCGF